MYLVTFEITCTRLPVGVNLIGRVGMF